MEELSKPARARRITRASRKHVTCYLPHDLYGAIVDISEQLGCSIAAVMSMALASYVRNWSPPLAKKGKKGQSDDRPWPSGWSRSEPCPACQKLHDPKEHPVNTVGGHRVKEAFEARGLDSD